MNSVNKGSLYNRTMRHLYPRMLSACAIAALMAAGVALSAQTQPAPPAATPAPAQPGTQSTEGVQTPGSPSSQSQGGVFRRTFDMVTSDVIARDNTGQFLPDLKKED